MNKSKELLDNTTRYISLNMQLIYRNIFHINKNRNTRAILLPYNYYPK